MMANEDGGMGRRRRKEERRGEEEERVMKSGRGWGSISG